MFAYQDTCEGDVVIDVAFTDRHGGVRDQLDLSDEADDPHQSTRDENIDILAHAVTRGAEASDPDHPFDRTPATTLPVVHTVRQVHAADVLDVDDTDPRTTYDADALVSARPGQALLVRAADCVPVLLADPYAGVVGAAHCGRLGLTAGVVPAVVAAMGERGARRIRAWIGPHVCGRCYEVPAEMREEVAGLVPAAGGTTSWGTPSLDLGSGVRSQLDAAGIPHHSVDRCTREDDDLWSYRRDGEAAGRQGGLVWIRP